MDEIQTEGFTRRHVGARGEFLLRINDDAGKMARRVGRRRAYMLASLETVAGQPDAKVVKLMRRERGGGK